MMAAGSSRPILPLVPQSRIEADALAVMLTIDVLCFLFLRGCSLPAPSLPQKINAACCAANTPHEKHQREAW